MSLRDSRIARYAPWLLSSMLFQAAMQGTRPTVSLYALSKGADPFGVGLMVALFSIGALLLTLAIGRLTDRVGGRTATLIGSFATGLSFLPVIFWDQLLSMALVQTLTGVFFLVSVVGAQHGVAAIADQNGEYAYGYGLLTTAISVGHLVGPGLMGVMVDQFGYGAAMRLAAVLCLAAGVLMLLAPPGGKRKQAMPGGQVMGEAFVLLRDPAIRAILLTGAIVLFAQDAIISFFPIYAGSLGLSATQMGVILSARGLALVVLRPFMSTLVNRFGQVRLLNGSLLSGAVATALLGVFTSIPSLVLTAVAAGLAIGLAQPLTMVMVAESTPREKRGLALSLRISGNRLGTTISPVIQGVLAGPLGAASPLWLSGMVLLLGSRLVARYLNKEST
jgi:MFS family permease